MTRDITAYRKSLTERIDENLHRAGLFLSLAENENMHCFLGRDGHYERLARITARRANRLHKLAAAFEQHPTQNGVQA